MENLTGHLLVFAPRVAAGIAVFSAFWITSLILSKFILRIGEKTDLDKHVLNLMRQTAKVALIVFGAVTALGTVGVNVTALVAGLGLAGFAIGFALKDALSNLIAAVLILVCRPFKLNDRIAVAGFEGTVTNINLRYTTIEEGNKKFLIPNSTVFNKTVTINREPGV